MEVVTDAVGRAWRVLAAHRTPAGRRWALVVPVESDPEDVSILDINSLGPGPMQALRLLVFTAIIALCVIAVASVEAGHHLVRR
jgi:hypothetical protein